MRYKSTCKFFGKNTEKPKLIRNKISTRLDATRDIMIKLNLYLSQKWQNRNTKDIVTFNNVVVLIQRQIHIIFHDANLIIKSIQYIHFMNIKVIVKFSSSTVSRRGNRESLSGVHCYFFFSASGEVRKRYVALSGYTALFRINYQRYRVTIYSRSVMDSRFIPPSATKSNKRDSETETTFSLRAVSAREYAGRKKKSV